VSPDLDGAGGFRGAGPCGRAYDGVGKQNVADSSYAPIGNSGRGLLSRTDEVRVSDRAHSAQWLNVQYLSMIGSLVSFGAVEPC